MAKGRQIDRWWCGSISVTRNDGESEVLTCTRTLSKGLMVLTSSQAAGQCRMLSCLLPRRDKAHSEEDGECGAVSATSEHADTTAIANMEVSNQKVR